MRPRGWLRSQRRCRRVVVSSCPARSARDHEGSVTANSAPNQRRPGDIFADVRVTAGVDLGGTAVNYTFITADGQWLIDGLCEHPARAVEGPDICLQQIADGLTIAATRAGIADRRRGGGGTRYAGAGQRRGASQRARLDQLRPRAVGELRHPRRARAQAQQAGDLPERRQRRRAVGALRDFRVGAGDVDFGDRRHRAGRRRDRGRRRS